MMMRVLFICVVSCLLVVNGGNIINRCSLARILYQEDLDGFEGYYLTDWLCLAFVESKFNLSKVNENADGTFDYGIFQINSRYWCNDYRSHSENFCHLDCQELLNPILIPSIHCAKKIVSGSGGMRNWGALSGIDTPNACSSPELDAQGTTSLCIKLDMVDWRLHCLGRPLSYWLTGCRLI